MQTRRQLTVRFKVQTESGTEASAKLTALEMSQCMAHWEVEATKLDQIWEKKFLDTYAEESRREEGSRCYQTGEEDDAERESTTSYSSPYSIPPTKCSVLRGRHEGLGKAFSGGREALLR